MADAKLVVIYPRPNDIEAFEQLYQKEHVPMAIERLAGKTKLVATKVVGFSSRNRALLPHCRDLFPLYASSSSRRRIGRREADTRPRRSNFFRRRAHFSGG